MDTEPELLVVSASFVISDRDVCQEEREQASRPKSAGFQDCRQPCWLINRTKEERRPLLWLSPQPPLIFKVVFVREGGAGGSRHHSEVC